MDKAQRGPPSKRTKTWARRPKSSRSGYTASCAASQLLGWKKPPRSSLAHFGAAEAICAKTAVCGVGDDPCANCWGARGVLEIADQTSM